MKANHRRVVIPVACILAGTFICGIVMSLGFAHRYGGQSILTWLVFGVAGPVLGTIITYAEDSGRSYGATALVGVFIWGIVMSFALARKYGGAGLLFGATVPVLATVATVLEPSLRDTPLGLAWWLFFLGSLSLAILGVRRNRLLLGITGATLAAGAWLLPTYVLCLFLAH